MDFLRYRFFFWGGGGGGGGGGQSEKRFVKNECACETVVLEDSFANLFSDFPQRRTVGKSKDRFLALKTVFGFRVLLEIRNPYLKIYIRISQWKALR